jgi:hypothetical protein
MTIVTGQYSSSYRQTQIQELTTHILSDVHNIEKQIVLRV